jgi:glycosyltransferase involved in cell wall biosynthesis
MAGAHQSESDAPRKIGTAPSEADSRILAGIAANAGIERVQFLAWRDLDDPEAGGSEFHAHRIASRWAAAGIDVHFRTSAVPGAVPVVRRDGYEAVRRSGRYAVFPEAALEVKRRGYRPGEALVEIWNGMPFFTPLWYRGPRVTFLHHVHAEMWRMALPGFLARLGDVLESKVAPPIYRRSHLVTLSASSRDEIVERLSMDRRRITVAPPGIETTYSPGGSRSKEPLVVAVGRLVPVKRFDLLLEALELAHRECPTLRAVIIGEGYERSALEARRLSLGAVDWVQFPGRVTDPELLSWYRQAWMVASTSLREGWGMTLTEAAACGTPAVATDIAGHRDAVVDGHSGLLVGSDPHEFAGALVQTIRDDALRQRLGTGALERSRWFNWDTTARITLEALAGSVRARHRPGAPDVG